MVEPIPDILAYWGVPDGDTPWPLAACPKCGGVVCRCLAVKEAKPELDESASRAEQPASCGQGGDVLASSRGWARNVKKRTRTRRGQVTEERARVASAV